MWTASSEPPSLRALGPYSAACEEHGADFLWLSPLGLMGAQRKEVSDLVASIQGPSGDRLGRELSQMQTLDVGILIVEGNWHWKGDVSERTGFTRARYRSLILGVQWLEGILVIETTGLEDTRATLAQLEDWFENPEQRNLRGRPKPRDHNPDVFTCQSVPGWNVRSAEALLDHFGKLPVMPTVSLEELCAVPGIGKGRARAFLKAFGGEA